MAHLDYDPPLKQAVQDVTRHIAYLKAERNLPGCSVALVHGDEIVWTEGFGLADHSRGIPASPRSVYKIASLTKLFTACLLMVLREEGMLNLDDPLSQYVPTVRVMNPFPDPQPLTFRQIAAHMAGLPTNVTEGEKAAGEDANTRDLLRWLRDTELILPPMSQYHYSNVGYAVMGHVLSVIGGMPYRKLLRHRIIDPLGLKSATFELKNVPKDRLAIGYRPYDEEGPKNGRPLRTAIHKDPGITAPVGGLYGSVLDLAKFVSWQFYKGARAPDRPLGTLALREMHAPVAVERDWTGGTSIGWRTGIISGFTYIGHMGGLAGYSSEIIAVPRLKLGFVALTNMDSTVGGICWGALARLIPLYAERLAKSE
mgnify:CR=1 FL=1